MSRKLVAGAVNTKLIVVLVVAVVIAGIFWGVKLTRSPADQMSPEQRAELEKKTYVLWCPDCKKEFTLTGVEAHELKRKGSGKDERIQCPECKKFVAVWGHRPPDEGQKNTIVAP